MELWGILRGWLSVRPPRVWGRPGLGAREASTRRFGGPHAMNMALMSGTEKQYTVTFLGFAYVISPIAFSCQDHVEHVHLNYYFDNIKTAGCPGAKRRCWVRPVK